jgi:hypothetical protein
MLKNYGLIERSLKHDWKIEYTFSKM